MQNYIIASLQYKSFFFTIKKGLKQKQQVLRQSFACSFFTYAGFIIPRDGQNRITFIVSQRASSIIHTDQIIVLEDGNMEGIGSHTYLMEIGSIYREIYESQVSSQ